MFCLAVLQQGHVFSGRHCCVHADQHGTRGWRCRSGCLESAAGLSHWWVTTQMARAGGEIKCVCGEQRAATLTSLTRWLSLSSLLRALAAERRCSPGAVPSGRRRRRSSQAGCEQRPPHLLLTWRPAQLACRGLRGEWDGILQR